MCQEGKEINEKKNNNSAVAVVPLVKICLLSIQKSSSKLQLSLTLSSDQHTLKSTIHTHTHERTSTERTRSIARSKLAPPILLVATTMMMLAKQRLKILQKNIFLNHMSSVNKLLSKERENKATKER